MESMTAVSNFPVLPKVKNDSDVVYDMGEAEFWILFKSFFWRGHVLVDEHDGSGCVDVVCFKSGKKYRHQICCSNKYSLLCRGCGKEI